MKIYLSARYPEPMLDKLKNEFELEINRSGKPATKAMLKKRLAEADGTIVLLNDRIDREIIDSASRLKVITLFAESLINIDLDYATRRGIMVTVTPGELVETTADLTWSLILATARRIPEADSYVRHGKFQDWSPSVMLGGNIYGKTLGIIGLGKIGQAVARRATGFNMDVIYTAAHESQPKVEKKLGCKYVEKEELLCTADFVSLNCKLTAETEHIIGKKELKMMKNTAYLINTGRGKLVCEQEFVKALKYNEIAGAGLDVFEFEPEVLSGLIYLNNVILTPHIGIATRENRYEMAKIAANDLEMALKGGIPRNIVNREVL